MKRFFIITIGFLIPFYVFSLRQLMGFTRATSITPLFITLFSVFFVIIMLFLYERFFPKKHNNLNSAIFGTVTSTIVGTICWINTSFLDERQRLPFLNHWERTTWYEFIYHNILTSTYGSVSVITGIVSGVLIHKLLQKFT